MKKYYIYYHRDPRPEYYMWKRYIGKGQKNRAYILNNRYAKHKHWVDYLKTLGLEPIIEIVEYFDNEEDAYKREIELILKYRNMKYDLCNTSDGGEGVRGLCGEKHPNWGKKHSKETKAKLSKAHMGKKSPEVSESNRRRAGEKRDSTSRIGNTHARKSVYCIENQQTYPSITIASKELSVSTRMIQDILKGKFKQVKGYSFKYA